MSSFDKYTNYNDQAGVSGVVFGANKSILEVELNEVQEINKKLLRNMVAKVCGDGITDITKITYENGVINIASDCSIAVDGVIINCTGLSMSVSSGIVYLQVWEEVVDYDAVLKKEGNQDSSEVINNYIKDNRINEETTRRKVVKYTLATSQDDSRHNLLIATISSEHECKINIHEINLAKLKMDFDESIGDIQTALDIIINGDPGIIRIPVPMISGTLTYTGDPQSVTDILVGYNSDQIDIGGSTTATNAGNYTATFTPKYGYAWSDSTYDTQNVDWSISKALCNLTLSHTSIALNGATPEETVTISKDGDGAVTVKSSDASIATATLDGNTITITALDEGTATITVSVAEGTNHSEATETISVTATDMVHIYGARWDGSSSTSWTRTDDAADFVDPVPYVSGASDYGSPFDDLQPWAGMIKSTHTEGVLVAIPKFWYKITQDGSSINIQIADKAVDGFHVSPAHMDRNDGNGERDVVYIGRYHCDSNYKSTSGVSPRANITRSSARSSIHNLGSNIWQVDFAMRFTIWLLYIVEFANWNSQIKIGKGCGNNSSAQSMGYTDSMPYHTGTTRSSRDTYGCGTQYRNIEGLWDNVFDWCDGCYNNSNGFNIILNPANFSDSSNGTSVGTPSSGYPSAFGVKDVNGAFPLFIPTASNGSGSTYSSDSWGFNASDPCVYVGGYYGQGGSYGLFYLYCNGVSSSYSDIGSRLQKLP